MSSGLFGMISGSGVANVVTTGTFTIPLMKRVGYRSEFAGAVEAAASTGGAYMPPIMAGGAFLVAQLTETSYFDIVKIATLPAILYYLSVGYMVFIRAVRRGLHGVDPSELPPWSRIIPRLHFLLPIPVMVYYLVIGDSAFLAAFKTICLIVMLKTCELLSNIKVPTADQTARPFLFVSIAFGVFSYYFGLKVGAPFAWFADTLRGMNWGDALFWTVTAFIVLKLAEIISTGLRAETGESEYDTGPILFRRLWELVVDIVKITWISLEAGARNTLVIGCIACVLGILLSCATQSDLSGRISILLTEFSFGLLPLTILWVIIAGYIVGMGLPITASYVVLVIFGVIALTNLGVPTLHAHLICFWVAVVSAVTPPVALAAYAASAIAVSDPVKTGFQALKTRLVALHHAVPVRLHPASPGRHEDRGDHHLHCVRHRHRRLGRLDGELHDAVRERPGASVDVHRLGMPAPARGEFRGVHYPAGGRLAVFLLRRRRHLPGSRVRHAAHARRRGPRTRVIQKESR